MLDNMRFLIAILFLPLTLLYAQENNDPGFIITIGHDSLFSKNPVIILENDKFIAVMRNCDRILHKYGSTDICIREWLVKTTDTIYDGFCVTGNPRREKINEIQIVNDGVAEKELLVRFGPRSKYYKRYTLLKDSSVIKVDYLKYETNSFDMVVADSINEMPNKIKEVMLFFGGDEWVRANKSMKESYWQTEREITSMTCIDIEQADIGWSLYKGYLITIVGNSLSGVGFGKVMPNWNMQQHTDLNKVFWDEGYAKFPTTASREFEKHLPLIAYIFLFNDGVPNAFSFGKSIVDSHLKNK